jgi:sodium/hydrogen exchanger 3
MVTLILGMVLGGFLIVDDNGRVATNRSSNPLLEASLFDVELFNLVLLPIIIFTSGYSLTPKSLFFKQIGSILLLAIVGTIISAFIIGGILYAVFANDPTLPQLDYTSMMIFGSLIAAIDPVATLSIFIKLKVDPRLSMILFGESIINDAVSIVLYTTFTTFVGLCGNIGALDILKAIGIFFGIFIGSVALAIVISMLASLSMKYVQMHSNLHQAMVLFLWSYMSFELATACHLSGICCSLFSGIFMGYLVPKSQSDEARKFTTDFFTVLAELSESVVFFQIGLNAVIYNVIEHTSEFPWMFSITTFLLCVLARIVAVCALTGVMNIRRKKTRFSWQHIVVLSHAGLRGAIAYALSLNFPVEVDSNGKSVTNLVVNATTFTILVTVFLLGPTTPPLLKCLKIPMGKSYVSGSSTANLRPWQKKVQQANQNKLLAWLTKNPLSHSNKNNKQNSTHDSPHTDGSDFLAGDEENGQTVDEIEVEMVEKGEDNAEDDDDIIDNEDFSESSVVNLSLKKTEGEQSLL